jgi:hypothetical protein
MVSLIPRAPGFASFLKPTAHASPCSLRLPAMSSSATGHVASAAAEASRPRKMPVLLFDIMDTVVLDPFYHHIPAFFQFRTQPYFLSFSLVNFYPQIHLCIPVV